VGKPSAAVAERRARVLQLRGIEHRPYCEIAKELGIPESTARSDYERAFAALKEQQQTTAAQARQLELDKLDALEEAVWEVLRRKHITVSHGKIIGRFTGEFLRDPETGELVRDMDGHAIPLYEEIEDDAPVLQAADRLVRIAQRRAALRGLDAPVKVEVDDGRLAAIRAIAERLAARRLGNMEPGGAGPAPGDPETPGSGGEAH
jgi:hypothetical protein